MLAAPGALAAPPVANDDTASFPSGLGDSSTSGPKNIGVLENDSDPDLDPFTVVSVTQPTLGAVAIAPGGFDVTFSPNTNRGTSSFTYTIEDINGEQDTATVTVTVTNRPPTACSPAVTAESGVLREGIVIVGCSGPPDPEGDEVQIISFDNPSANGGTVSQTPSTSVVFDYTSAPGFTGTDTFGFTIQDSFGAIDSGTVTVTVTAFVNNPPVAENVSAQARAGPTAGKEVVINLPANDPDGQVLDVSVPIGPSKGTIIVSPSGLLISYTPNPGTSGDDIFDYQVSDGAGGTDTATITVNVLDNQNPVALDDAATTSVWPGFVQINVLGNDGDPEGDALPNRDIVFVTQPQNGFLEQGCAGSCNPPTYTPNQGFSGVDTFTYRAVDELGGQSNVATVTITVGDVAPPPVAVDDVVTTFKDQPIAINVLANDTDATTVASVTQPSQGGTVTISPSQTQVDYTPPSGFRGTETFQYEAEGLGEQPDTATVTVTVQNRVPVATADTASATTDSPVLIPVLSNDSDEDGDTLFIASFGTATNGAVAQRGQSLEYTSFPGFTGTDTFDYTVHDGFGGSASGFVTVTVVAGNAPPTAVIAGGNRTITDTDQEPGEFVDLDGTASFDPDGTITGCQWTIRDVQQGLSCSESNAVRLEDGVNVITLTVVDDAEPAAQSPMATVTITVVGPGENEPPVAAIAGGNRPVADTDGAAGEVVRFDGSGSSDVDGFISGYEWSVNGQVLPAATGPTPLLRLDDRDNTVRLVVTDNGGLRSEPLAVTVTVAAPQPAPVVTIEGGSRSIPDGDEQPGELVPFRGVATDPDGSVAISSFRWIVNDVAITAADGQAEAVLPLVQGVNVITLTATDNDGLTGSDSVSITLGEPNQIAEIPGLTPNQESTANGTEDTCSRLLKLDPASLSEEERNLRATCGAIFQSASDGDVAAVTEALDAISGEQITSQQTTAIDFSMTQLLNVGARLQALRMGSRGFSTAGLNFGNPIGGVPVSALASLGKLLLGEGGASGEDEEGGLLDRRLGIFVNGSIRWGDKDRTERESGFDFESEGLTIGADYRFADGFVAGLALGYASGDADFDNDGGSQDSDGYSGTVYGTWYDERSYFDAIGSYGQVSYDSIRNINISSLGITDRALGDTDADQWALGVGYGYDFGKGALRFGPTLALNYIKIEVDGFTETTEGTSGLAMRFDDQSADSLTAKVGAQLAYNLSRKWGIFTPQARFELVHEYKNDSQQVTVRFANDTFVGTPGQPGSGFVVLTDEPDEDYFNWAVGFSATFANGFSGFVDYESTESLSTITMQELSFGLRYETKFR
jgi:uncharacterized protein YhjY with autotransporter beta-barrel domain